MVLTWKSRKIRASSYTILNTSANLHRAASGVDGDDDNDDDDDDDDDGDDDNDDDDVSDCSMLPWRSSNK